MNWVSNTAVSTSIMVATGGDLLVYWDVSIPFPGQIAIRRRNSEGDYPLVANSTVTYTPDARTNGKWVVMIAPKAVSGPDLPNTLFSVDADNKVSEQSTIYTTDGFILSDDTFVGYDPEMDGEVFYLRTYEYNSAIKNWTVIAAANLPVTTDVEGKGDWRSYQVSDTHLSITDYSNSSNYRIQIYARQPNKSWNMTDDFSTNVTFSTPGSPFFNGVDTVAYAIPEQGIEDGSYGIVYLFTKTNGEWSLQNYLTVASVGYKRRGYLGYKCLFLDADTLLVNAASEEAPDMPYSAGRVLMLTRDSNGVWQPVADIDGGDPFFGKGMNVNNHDLIISAILTQLRFHSAPKCFHHPINVTCNSQQVTDCNDLSRSELYTLNNPECGAVDATLLGVSLINNQALEMQFSFARQIPLGAATVSCTTTVTCPAPPVAPVAAVAPVGKVSAAPSSHFGVASLFGTLVASLFFM